MIPGITAQDPAQSAAAPAGYVGAGVHFGGSAWLTIPSLAATDNAFYSFSLWVNSLTVSTNNSDFYVTHDAANAFQPTFWVSNVLTLVFDFGPSPPLLEKRFATLASGWHHLLGTVQTNLSAGNKLMALYLNDVLQTATTTSDGDASFNLVVNGKSLVFGADGAGAGIICDFADVWLAPGISLLTGTTISLTDRRKFIDALGKPVDPVNFPSAPVMFLGNNTTFATNQGSGGAATLTGSLTAASSNP
jgi:hypothetical protein